MLLYQFRMGTNPRRVIIYLAEKGIDVPRYELDYTNDEHRSSEYRKINPAGRAPTLILESGLAVTDSALIVEYLEERHPERPLIGSDPVERARVRAVGRLGTDLVGRCQTWLWNATSAFSAKVPSPSAARGRTLTRAQRGIGALLLLAVCMLLAERVGLVALIAGGYRLLAWVFFAVYVLPLATVGVWQLLHRSVPAPEAL